MVSRASRASRARPGEPRAQVSDRDNGSVPAGPVIALIDGEHHPAAVRAALERLDEVRGVAGAIFCGGEEKLPAGSLDAIYGRPVAASPDQALPRLAPLATAVVDLADEPVLPASGKLRLAALALHLGLAFESPGARLEPPRYASVDFDGPKLAVIGTGKRTGKTAVAGHWAALLRAAGHEPALVCMGRGGPAEPTVAHPDTALEDLIAIVEGGGHGASDYLEGAVLAGVTTIGCRRVGGGLAGAPAESNVAAGAALAASRSPAAMLFEGSGACIPPVAVNRTVCVAGAGAGEPFADYRMLRADLVLAAEGSPVATGARERLCFRLLPEPAEPLPAAARVALFTTRSTGCAGVEPVVSSAALARRDELAADLDHAAAERCEVYLTELKAGAIDLVARRARRDGARVVFVRNRPVGIDADLDSALLRLHADA